MAALLSSATRASAVHAQIAARWHLGLQCPLDPLVHGASSALDGRGFLVLRLEGTREGFVLPTAAPTPLNIG